MDKNYVVVKLISGETVMATFEGEDDKYIKIEFPIQIRTVMHHDVNKESISASPLCQFSESTSFILEKAHIVYIKKLHKQFVPHYNNFIKSYEEALIPTTRSSAREALKDYFEDAEDLTIEEVDTMLSIMEGNDTLH